MSSQIVEMWVFYLIAVSFLALVLGAGVIDWFFPVNSYGDREYRYSKKQISDRVDHHS